ncbi:hypothetical protein CEXT_725411 [Caerostris extrusa]|uniref:Uncharacterized protein n=1 Tax=Caerostris extrusa TaxID=172846 RepID=A0AAV4XMZ1_CAEEX|nr:hypothetical protein CEXT_725411 [Caerostris extrusa]
MQLNFENDCNASTGNKLHPIILSRASPHYYPWVLRHKIAMQQRFMTMHEYYEENTREARDSFPHIALVMTEIPFSPWSLISSPLHEHVRFYCSRVFHA